MQKARARLEAWQIALVGGVFVAGLVLVAHGINKVFLGDGILLAIDGDKSIGSFYSAANFLVAGALCLWAASTDAPRRRWWALAGLLFLAFGADDFLSVHEASEEAANDLSRLLLQPAVAGVGCAVLVTLGRQLPGPAGRLAKAAGFLLVLGVALSLFNSYVTPPHVIYVALMYVEEVSEMLMATCLIAAVLASPRTQVAGAPQPAT